MTSALRSYGGPAACVRRFADCGPERKEPRSRSGGHDWFQEPFVSAERFDANRGFNYQGCAWSKLPLGKVVKYAVSLLLTACVFKKGCSLELVIGNQDDILSRHGTWGVYMLPFMQTVTHEIHFGNSHLLVPHIMAGAGNRVRI